MKENRFKATFFELTEPRRIVESIQFVGDHSDLTQPTSMTVDLIPDQGATCVTITAANLPSSVSSNDNDL